MSLAQLSISQLAEITGQDRKTIAKYLAQSGLEPQMGLKGAKNFAAAEALRILLAITNVGTTEDVAQKQAEAKLRSTVAEADKRELDLAIRRGEYLRAEEVISQVENEYSFIRANLSNIPNALARQLALEESPDAVNAALTKAIDDCLSRLTTTALEVSNAPEDEPGDSDANLSAETYTSTSESVEASTQTIIS